MNPVIQSSAARCHRDTDRPYVDALGIAPVESLLFAQIQAGGQGLNIQAGSVVVLAEPQVKPT